MMLSGVLSGAMVSDQLFLFRVATKGGPPLILFFERKVATNKNEVLVVQNEQSSFSYQSKENIIKLEKIK